MEIVEIAPPPPTKVLSVVLRGDVVASLTIQEGFPVSLSVVDNATATIGALSVPDGLLGDLAAFLQSAVTQFGPALNTSP